MRYKATSLIRVQQLDQTQNKDFSHGGAGSHYARVLRGHAGRASVGAVAGERTRNRTVASARAIASRMRRLLQPAPRPLFRIRRERNPDRVVSSCWKAEGSYRMVGDRRNGIMGVLREYVMGDV